MKDGANQCVRQIHDFHIFLNTPNSLIQIFFFSSFFETNTNDYRWCKFAENKLMKNTRKVTKALEDYKKEYLSTYETGVRAVKYDKGIEFFSERRDMVIDALGKFKLSCPKLRSYIIEAMTKFTERFVIWDEKQQYDLLNKFSTHQN